MEKNIKELYDNNFIKPIVFWGRITNVAAFFVAFLPALYLIIFYKAVPPVGPVIEATIATISVFAVFWVVEPLSFYPILGMPGTYMSFLAGNISNMRIPCSIASQASAGVEEGTIEGSIISVFGIGVSILVNLAVMTMGAFVGAKLIAAFPPVVSSAFTFILPAVFGSVFGQFAPRNLKLAAFALALAIIIAKLPIPSYFKLPLCVFITIYVGLKTQGKKKSYKTSN